MSETANKEAQKWNQSIPFNTDNYIMRVMEEKFGPSSKGNPMVTLDFEMATESMEVAGVEYTISGNKTRQWYPVTVLEDGVVNPDKTAKARARLVEVYTKFGLDASNINWDNPELGFKTKLVHVRGYNKEEAVFKTPTKEQLEKGQRQGDALVNPVTGQPVMKNVFAIGEIYGLAPEDANKPFGA